MSAPVVAAPRCRARTLDLRAMDSIDIARNDAHTANIPCLITMVSNLGADGLRAPNEFLIWIRNPSACAF